MLGNIIVVENIYIACGYTEIRKPIDGLVSVVQEQFHLDPFSSSLFLFCGKRRDRMKVLLWEGDGFVLLYKRLENGNFKWPRKESEVKSISWQELRWLMEGLELEQKHVINPAKPDEFCWFKVSENLDFTGFLALLCYNNLIKNDKEIHNLWITKMLISSTSRI